MIETGSLVRVKRSEYYYGIREDLYEAAHNFGPVRVRKGGTRSFFLDFGFGTEIRNQLSALIWPLERLEECREERVSKPDMDALFDMIGL